MFKPGLLMSMILLGCVTSVVRAQQVSDPAFQPVVERPQYASGAGPTVLIDSAHLNFHTAEGGYAPFAALLQSDGYRVGTNREAFTASVLARGSVLVVANAMHKQSEAEWAPLPNLPAFTEAEVVAVEHWVRNGGALLLIADHMPLPAHAEALAAAFGIRFQNGFAYGPERNATITFRRSDGSLGAGLVSDGRDASERVDHVTTFTGQAFRMDPGVKAQPLLILAPGSELLLPEEAFKFSDRTPRIPAANLLQGALVEHGRGRVAVFGEAAMFGAQLAGPQQRRIGMNAPEADQNARFALNVLHWLSGVL